MVCNFDQGNGRAVRCNLPENRQDFRCHPYCGRASALLQTTGIVGYRKIISYIAVKCIIFLCIFALNNKITVMIFSSELIKGTLKTIVLKQLEINSRMYGYEITQRVKELTLNKIQITEGALYPTLHALEAEGLVTTEAEFIGKRVRKYYSLSPKGQSKIIEKIDEMAEFIETMKFLLDIKPQTV